MAEVAVVATQYSDQLWRLNSLYSIVDPDGRHVPFRLNSAQQALWRDMTFRNVILKARQLGFSTFIDLFILDSCLFNPNLKAGIIAHSKDDAKEIFRTKVKYPYDHLPDALRGGWTETSDRADELIFDNGSSIRVATSMRSGTVQLLHVSELGRIAQKYPDKAREIKTGAFEAVARDQMIFVESTAAGRQGAFFDLVATARKLAVANTPLTKLDFKFHFFPWWQRPDYQLSHRDALTVPITSRMGDYFKALQDNHGIELSRGQKAWYIKKEATLGWDVRSEHPSHPDEAFEASVEGAYFAAQMQRARAERRICKVPHQDGIAVDTWWDLGIGDDMSIWFSQTVGREVHVIDYYANCGEGFAHYAAMLSHKRDELGYHYGRHVGPHDLAVRELGPGTSRLESAKGYGIRFEIAPRCDQKADDIEAARNFLGRCWFDESRCDAGITHLDNYRKEWDDRLGVWKDSPRHDESSHGADAFMVLARQHHRISNKGSGRANVAAPPPRGAWT